MLERDDIRFCYRFLLGREPESEDAYSAHEHHADVDMLRRILLESGEGQERLRRDLRDHMVAWDFAGDCDREQLVLIHLEKTGGTALYAALLPNFEDGRASAPHMAFIPDLSLGELNSYDFIAGHFSYLEAASMPRRAKRIVALFRDPVDRLISFYRFQRAHPHSTDPLVALAKELPAEAYFRHPAVVVSPRVDNAYLRAFATIPSGDARTNQTMHQALILAKARVAGLDMIGLTDRMDLSARMLSVMAGLRLPTSIAQIHTTDGLANGGSGFAPVDPVVRTPGLIEALTDLVAYDRQIYLVARTRFDALRVISGLEGWSG